MSITCSDRLRRRQRVHCEEAEGEGRLNELPTVLKYNTVCKQQIWRRGLSEPSSGFVGHGRVKYISTMVSFVESIRGAEWAFDVGEKLTRDSAGP